MPSYRVKTDQGTYRVNLDSEPSSPEQLQEVVQLHLSGQAADQMSLRNDLELERLSTEPTIPPMQERSVGSSIMTGIRNIPSAVVNTVKDVGKAAITRPEEGFFTPVSPMKSVERFGDVLKGVASGLSMGIYQPQAATEAERARQIGGMVAGSAVPFSGITKAGRALGLGRGIANVATGTIAGAARPLSEGDVYGAIEGAATSGGASLIPEAIAGTTRGVRSIVSREKPQVPNRIPQLETEAGSFQVPVIEAQTKAAKIAAETRTRTANLEANKAVAQRSLAGGAQSLRQAETELGRAKASQIRPNEKTVERVADSLASKPIDKAEAGQFFQKKYRELKKLASDEGGAKYDEAAALTGDQMFNREGFTSAIDAVMDEAGTLRSSLSSAPKRIIKDVSEASIPAREGMVTPFQRAGKGVMQLEDDFFHKYKNYFPPKKPGEPDVMPLELWRDLTSGKMGDPRATVGDMILDRQKVRAAKRAAESVGRNNEARQLGMLEDGITTDIKGASPETTSAINAADAYWRNEYIPRFGYKALTTKGAKRSPEDVVNFFFRKDSSKDAIQVAERLSSTLTNPSDVARMGRAWLDGIVKRSMDKTTGQFNNDAFLKEYLSYPDRVREIAAGGKKAKTELDAIAELMQDANRTDEQIVGLERAVKESQKTVTAGAKEIERLAKVNPYAELETAASEVSRVGKQQARAKEAIDKEIESQIAAREAEANRPNDILRRGGNYAMGSGMLAIGFGVASGNPAAVTGGMVTIGTGSMARLLASPKGRHAIMETMKTRGRNTRDAVVWASRINGILKTPDKTEGEER